jgi:hypothetical protein
MLVVSSIASARVPSEVPLADVLDVLVLDREVLAVDARSGGQVRVSLRLNERVHWYGSRGLVAVALTDQRILAVAIGSGAWQQAELQRGEAPPSGAELGERIALIATSVRVLGFDGGSGNLVESRLGIREKLLQMRVGATVGVAVTDRRALALSSDTGGLFTAKIGLEERLEAVAVSANLATVTTQRRLLVFRGPTGTWEERHRTLR